MEIATADPDTDNLPAAAALGNSGTFATEAAKLRAALPKLQAAADGYAPRRSLLFLHTSSE